MMHSAGNMENIADGKHLILASGSPRRRELLGAIAPDMSVAPKREIDETYPADIPAMEVAQYLSRLKADAYRDLVTPGSILVTADTVVIIDDEILGKPVDRDEAVAMLRHLSGRTHQVVTGVTVCDGERTESFSDVTDVTFAPLSDDEIAYYVDRYAPFDKAGAYGIQEWIGYIGVESIKGCYYNVMGLPLQALYMTLKTF